MTPFVITTLEPQGTYAVGVLDLDTDDLGVAAREAYAQIQAELPGHILVKITNADSKEHIEFGDAGPHFTH